MRGKAVAQCMNANALGNAGACRGQANDAVELACTAGGEARGSRRPRVGKIAALQRDLEEEPQGSGTDVDGRYRRADRRQPQLVAMDILGGGLVGRPAQKIGKPFDVADKWS